MRLILAIFRLAMQSRSPLFTCALDQINDNVGKRRVVFGSWVVNYGRLRHNANRNLMVTGPHLLAECLDDTMNVNFIWCVALAVVLKR